MSIFGTILAGFITASRAHRQKPKNRFRRDSPDDSRTGVSIGVLRPCHKTDARCRRITGCSASPNGGRGADLAI
ncbi:MAG: hypothetical protein NTV56_21750, partial [Alphaproteobacteria bacterium]|nr:hypothetical protein [Alphaproteobacteria bacterium]